MQPLDHAIRPEFGDHCLQNSSIEGASLHLTVLFADLSDSVQWSQHLDCRAYVELLREVRSRSQAVVASFGGQIARMQGDGILAFFGLHGASDDDGRNAVACALELHARIDAIDPAIDTGYTSRLALHTGIHAGLTHLEAGDVERGRFDLIGNTPNLAARLSASAGRNAILASEKALAGHVSAFANEGRLWLKPKGWGEPVAAYRILAKSHSSSAPHVSKVTTAHSSQLWYPSGKGGNLFFSGIAAPVNSRAGGAGA